MGVPITVEGHHVRKVEEAEFVHRNFQKKIAGLICREVELGRAIVSFQGTHKRRYFPALCPTAACK